MALTYDALSTVTCTGNTSSIDFTNIPQTYTDLLLLLSLRGNGYNATDVNMRFNSDTGSNYGYRLFWKDGNSTSVTGSTVASAVSMFTGFGTGSNTTASAWASNSIYIPNYTLSRSKVASIESVTEANTSDTWNIGNAGIWTGTAAITSISLFPPTGGQYYIASSTVTLYGIKSA